MPKVKRETEAVEEIELPTPAVLYETEANDKAESLAQLWCEEASRRKESVIFVVGLVKTADCGLAEYILTANPDGTFTHGINESA